MTENDLALDEAQLDQRDRWEIFRGFLIGHLFDSGMSDAEFIAQLELRRAALCAAGKRMVKLLEANDK